MNPRIRFLLNTALSWMLAGMAMASPLRIVTIDGPPWGFVGKDGQATGMMFEVGNRIAELAGLQYTNSLVPYARTALALEVGTADVILRFSNAHMEQVAMPVAAVVSMPIIVVGPRGVQFRSLEDLHGKTVGVIRTSNYVKAFDESTAIHKYAVNDYQVMARMLENRRLDAGIGASAGVYYGALMAGLKPEALGPPLVLGSNDFVLFYSKKTLDPIRIQALKRAVEILQASGEIQKIVSKYVGRYEALPSPRTAR